MSRTALATNRLLLRRQKLLDEQLVARMSNLSPRSICRMLQVASIGNKLLSTNCRCGRGFRVLLALYLTAFTLFNIVKDGLNLSRNSHTLLRYASVAET